MPGYRCRVAKAPDGSWETLLIKSSGRMAIIGRSHFPTWDEAMGHACGTLWFADALSR